MVIGYDELAVTILTAHHVIEDALTGQSTTRVTVLFPGTSNWRDCEIGPTLSDSRKPDAAFLKVKRSDTPFAGSPRCSEIVVSPPPQAGAGVYVYGLDPSKNGMVWRPGVLNGVADGVVSFDGMEVVGGYYGGLLTY